MSDLAETDRKFLGRVALAAAIARDNADEVDRNGRFPIEAIRSLKSSGCLGAALSTEFGGSSVSLPALSRACTELSSGCSSTGMIFAMHQIQIACIAQHFGSSARLDQYLTEVAGPGRLISSGTSEVSSGGDIGRSVAALEPLPNQRHRIEKDVPTMSYGEMADDILLSLRSSPESLPTDQMLVLVPRENVELDVTNQWDAMGMRGTCSSGFIIRSEIDDALVLKAKFSPAAIETMISYAHILWAHCWLGIAVDAFERCRNFCKRRRRSQRIDIDSKWDKLAEMSIELSNLRAIAFDALTEYMSAKSCLEERKASRYGYAVRINNTKLAASVSASRICLSSLETIGMPGYQHGGDESVNRHVRDILSAPLMISNARIRSINSQLLQTNDGIR